MASAGKAAAAAGKRDQLKTRKPRLSTTTERDRIQIGRRLPQAAAANDFLSGRHS
jgi:hypothetical protein